MIGCSTHCGVRSKISVHLPIATCVNLVLVYTSQILHLQETNLNYYQADEITVL